MFIIVFTTVHHWTLPSLVLSALYLHILFPRGLFVRPYKLRCSHLFFEGIPSGMLLAFPFSMYGMSHSPPFALLIITYGEAHTLIMKLLLTL